MELKHHLIQATQSTSEQSLALSLPSEVDALYLVVVATSGGKNPGPIYDTQNWLPVVEFASIPVHCWCGVYVSKTGLNPTWRFSSPVVSIIALAQVIRGAEVADVNFDNTFGTIGPSVGRNGPASVFWFQDWQGNTVMQPEHSFSPSTVGTQFFEYRSSNDTTAAHCFVPNAQAGRLFWANSYPGTNYGGSVSVSLRDVAASVPADPVKDAANKLREIAAVLDTVAA